MNLGMGAPTDGLLGAYGMGMGPGSEFGMGMGMGMQDFSGMLMGGGSANNFGPGPIGTPLVPMQPYQSSRNENRPSHPGWCAAKILMKASRRSTTCTCRRGAAVRAAALRAEVFENGHARFAADSHGSSRWPRLRRRAGRWFVGGSLGRRVAALLPRGGSRGPRAAFPEAGPVLVSGKTLDAVQQSLQQVLRTQFRDVSADVSLARLRTVRVYEVGDVVNPGAYDISSLSTPLNALVCRGRAARRAAPCAF